MHSDLADPVNIGNPQEMTVLEMAEEIRRITGSKSRIVFAQLPEDDPKVRQPDITLAKEKLDWEPQVDVREALRLTIDWFGRTGGGV
jgi:dTDP-glucose 4,6-dehydratase